MEMSRVSNSLTPAASAMQISISGGVLSHVNVPTRDQATVAVAQVRDALDSMYVSSQSLRARATSSNHVNNRAMVAFRLMTESPQAQEVVAQVVSDPNVFSAIWGRLQEKPVYRNIVETMKRIKEEATSCLIPRDREDLTEDDEISSFAERTSCWVRMFRMIVEVVTDMWSGFVDMFASAIPKIQAAFAREGDAAGDSHALETAIVITGLVVLVTAVIVAGAVLLL